MTISAHQNDPNSASDCHGSCSSVAVLAANHTHPPAMAALSTVINTRHPALAQYQVTKVMITTAPTGRTYGHTPPRRGVSGRTLRSQLSLTSTSSANTASVATIVATPQNSENSSK